MTSILKRESPSQPWGQSSTLFLHNWRCAGSTLNSLLASNFTDNYLKVGGAFNAFGWPDPSQEELINLASLRRRFKPGCIVGGHLFMGLDAWLPGPWQLWMNAREPLSRLRSGILRFHASGEARIREQDLMERTSSLETASDLKRLLNGPLRREGNGLCRRLAGLAASADLTLNAEGTNLERLPLLEAAIPAQELFKLAKANLGRLDILLIAEYLQASILSLETTYSLQPLINPFSNLRHNQASLGKPQQKHLTLLEQCRPMLQQHILADLKLWPLLQQHFQQQLSRTKISKRDIRIRELIHKERLINPIWMTSMADQDTLIKAWAAQISKRALEEPELGERLIDTVCSWSRLEDSAAEKIHFLSHKAFQAMR